MANASSEGIPRPSPSSPRNVDDVWSFSKLVDVLDVMDDDDGRDSLPREESVVGTEMPLPERSPFVRKMRGADTVPEEYLFSRGANVTPGDTRDHADTTRLNPTAHDEGNHGVNSAAPPRSTHPPPPLPARSDIGKDSGGGGRRMYASGDQLYMTTSSGSSEFESSANILSRPTQVTGTDETFTALIDIADGIRKFVEMNRVFDADSPSPPVRTLDIVPPLPIRRDMSRGRNHTAANPGQPIDPIKYNVQAGRERKEGTHRAHPLSSLEIEEYKENARKAYQLQQFLDQMEWDALQNHHEKEKAKGDEMDENDNDAINDDDDDDGEDDDIIQDDGEEKSADTRDCLNTAPWLLSPKTIYLTPCNEPTGHPDHSKKEADREIQK